MMEEIRTDLSIARTGRILVIDDEVRMCLSLKSLLERENYEVVISSLGNEAMQLLLSGNFDLVLTDIRMPGKDGIDILQKSKEIDPNIVVILMTGFAPLETAKAAINRGAFDYLAKPIEFDELLKSIRKGLATRNAQLEKQHLLELLSGSNHLLEDRVNQLHALYKSAGVLSGTIELRSLLQQVVNLVAGVVGAKAGSIMLVDENENCLRLSAAIGIDTQNGVLDDIKVHFNEGVAGYVAANKESVIINDIAKDPRFLRTNRAKYETSSAISTPIIHGDKLLGVLNLNNKEGQQIFSDEDLRLMETFASHAAIAIVNARLFEENRKKINELSILHKIASKLSSSMSEAEVFSCLFQGIKSIVDADLCYFFSVGDDDGLLKVAFAEDSNENSSRAMLSSELKLPLRIPAFAAAADKKLCVEQFLQGIFLKNLSPPLSVFIAVPVSVENSLSGVLCVGSYHTRNYTDDDKRLISIIASQTASLYERQKSIINGSKLLMMGKMISELTHDLKKPLTNIKGTLQVLEVKWNETGARERFLGSAIQEVNRLAELVREMLDFADPGKYKRIGLDVVPLIEKVLSLLASDIRKSNVEVSMNCPAGLPKIFVNETEIFEALLNVLFNAIESMPNGGILGISTSECKFDHVPTPFLRIRVSDEGCGIPKDKINRIFERYYTTKEGGTGLGLALVKRIMQSHNGFVDIESEIGKGTIFYLNFPINN